ncbi:unnamed protein product [Heligmosomoides polygyrus]|uniref:ELMO domain-containing protein n=1 Tax=Heligmosomoides polygyrus TaxID=6339 RepID=A0A183G4Q9_HELPZ|nr:unnamed protein product [Heligmosomoides polygyrus]
MSDEALAFYNGYKASFPSSSTELNFCRFHVLQSWKRKVKQCIKKDQQKSVIAALRQLLRISDESAFHNRLGEVLTYLHKMNCSQMLEYLQNEYSVHQKIKQWAAFNRRGVVMSTSMFGERWHLRIKQEKLKRKANSRVDYVVDMLIKSVDELAVRFEITDRRQLSSSFRVKENNIQHRLALKFYKNKISKIIKVGRLAWNVEAATSDTIYRVEFEDNCNCPSQSYTIVYSKINALVRQGDDDDVSTLTKIAEHMRIASEVEVGNQSTAPLLPRPEIQSGVRHTLQKVEIFTVNFRPVAKIQYCALMSTHPSPTIWI